MNSLQIRYFLHLSGTGNVSETARQLFVAQPAVSKQIAALEKELGFRLFERTNRGVTLTSGGKRMYEYFNEAAKQYRQAVGEAEKQMSDLSDALNIGILENLGVDELQSVIWEMKRKYPSLSFNVMRLSIGTLIRRLFDGLIDVAITFDHAMENRAGIQYVELFLEQSMFIISRDHPLAEKKTICPQDLSGEIICRTVDCEGLFSDAYLLRLINALNIRPGGYLNSDNMASGLAAVETNHAVGLIDERSQLVHPERYRLIASGTYQSVVAAYLEHNRNPYVSQFTQALQKQFEAVHGSPPSLK